MLRAIIALYTGAHVYLIMAIIKSKLSDRSVGNIFALIIIIYIVCYGLFIAHGFHTGKFDLVYLSILVPIFLVDSIKTVVECLLKGCFYKGRQNLSKVTVVIPTKNGENVLGDTIKDLLKRFPKDRIIIASNGSTDKTCELARKYGVIVVEILEGVGKVRAINMVMDKVQTPYTLILDDDTLIGKAKIPTKALDNGYEGVAFRVVPQIENWVSKIQMYEYRKSMDIGKLFHNRKATVQNISGAIGLFHTKELIRQIQIHTGEFSGEDLQRTLLIHLSKNSKGVVISDSVIVTKAPSSLKLLYLQRVYGWNPGLLSNLSNYFKLLFYRRTPFTLRYDAFYNSFLVVMCDILRLVALPIIVFYPWYFVVLYFIYIAIEVIPYFATGRQDPFWVILIYPFYGLFSFLTRIISSVVFLYRRLVVKLSRYASLDDYRNGCLICRIISSFISLSLGSIALLITIAQYNYLPYFYSQTPEFSVDQVLTTSDNELYNLEMTRDPITSSSNNLELLSQ